MIVRNARLLRQQVHGIVLRDRLDRYWHYGVRIAYGPIGHALPAGFGDRSLSKGWVTCITFQLASSVMGSLRVKWIVILLMVLLGASGRGWLERRLGFYGEQGWSPCQDQDRPGSTRYPLHYRIELLRDTHVCHPISK